MTTPTVTRLPQDGMITLRADLSDPAVQSALQDSGLSLPEARAMVATDAANIGWMSPDELLLLCAPADVDPLLARIAECFSGLHHMAVNVSDARVRFRIEGQGADLVLARLCPADMARFPKEEIRRSRLAQVPAAFWRDGDAGLALVCFRSVSDYAEAALQNACLHLNGVALP